MRSKSKFFKNDTSIPVDKFFQTVLYDKKIGYYNSKLPFGKSGDYITAPLISNLFSEMIGIWMVSTWEKMGKPKFFNIVELGPGDGSLTRNLIQVFKSFSKFNSIKKIYLYETSSNLKNVQKKNINNKDVQWINDFKKITKGPVIFFGNEFFDAIPIKQFKRKNNNILEKYYFLGKDNKIQEIYKNAKKNDVKILKMFESLKNLEFIEFPKFGLNELKKIIKKISKLNGCILMIDYGYLKPSNKSTLQSVFMHNKNRILDNLGKADVTSHVNFLLLKEFFQKNKLNVKKVISQKRFLESLGIMERAKTISEKMKFNEQTNLYLRLRRILSPRSMGELFKVILAYKFKNVDYHEFK